MLKQIELPWNNALWPITAAGEADSVTFVYASAATAVGQKALLHGISFYFLLFACDRTGYLKKLHRSVVNSSGTAVIKDRVFVSMGGKITPPLGKPDPLFKFF